MQKSVKLDSVAQIFCTLSSHEMLIHNLEAHFVPCYILFTPLNPIIFPSDAISRQETSASLVSLESVILTMRKSVIRRTIMFNIVRKRVFPLRQTLFLFLIYFARCDDLCILALCSMICAQDFRCSFNAVFISHNSQSKLFLIPRAVARICFSYMFGWEGVEIFWFVLHP
jgi:hypothetical protein